MSSSTVIHADAVPLRLDDGGTIRVGQTRVTLDTIWYAFIDGASAETIADQYPAVRLEDVYSVIGYILRHREEVEEHVRRREAEAEAVQRQNESRCNPVGIRERLLARQRGKES